MNMETEMLQGVFASVKESQNRMSLGFVRFLCED